MEQIFDLGPGFRAVAPNVPKMSRNRKIVTYPTVFELGRSSLRIMLTHPRAKKFMEQIFDSGPGLWSVAQNVPKMAQN